MFLLRSFPAAMFCLDLALVRELVFAIRSIRHARRLADRTSGDPAKRVCTHPLRAIARAVDELGCGRQRIFGFTGPSSVTVVL